MIKNVLQCNLFKKFFYTATLLVIGFSVQAQVKQNTGWFASFNKVTLNDKFSLHLELQIRSTDDWEQIQMILPRVGLNYHIKDNQIITPGYAYIPNRVTLNGNSSLLAEHRIFQQYIISHNAWSASVSHRFRFEERFLPIAKLDGNKVEKDGYKYTSRFRYFVRAIIPLTAKKPFIKGPYLGLQEELFLNVTNLENVNGNVFDQNRAYGALGYRISKKLDMELGYLHQYVSRRRFTGSNFNNDVSNNVFQLAVYTKF